MDRNRERLHTLLFDIQYKQQLIGANFRLNAYPGVVIILKKGAARGLRDARPSSAFQLLLVADCEETECHKRGMSVRVSLGSVSHMSDFSRASYMNELLGVN